MIRIPSLVLLLASIGWTLNSTQTLAATEVTNPRLNAILVWGTNGEKPADQELKPISPDLSKRLRRIFKWKDYFEITRKTITAETGSATKTDMSRECRLEITHFRDHEFQIRLFGKGVLVVTKRQNISPGETVVLGGDDKNDNAWFVVLSLATSKAP
jgi:hypothetical protein